MDLPPLIPTPSESKQTIRETGAYGIHDVMIHGFASVKNSLSAAHPLEGIDQQCKANAEKMKFAVARSVQGLHAPLKLAFERKAAKEVGRLPFLPSSNLMLEVLEGTDDTISFEDIYNDPMEMIEVLRPPHLIMEKHLKLI